MGSVGQDKDGTIRSFDFVKEIFDERVRIITEGAGCDTYILFLTADKQSTRMENRERKRIGEAPIILQPNFRDALAIGKAYKGTRKQDKPFHWINLTAYILSKEAVEVANGYEADDSIAMAHIKNPDTTVICTRDKDLRMVPGSHYGWECGKQPEFGPVEYDSVGNIELVRGASGNKIRGGGFAFFASQLLTGDVVDNIGGLKGIGPVAAYDILQNCTTEREYFNAVVSCYQKLLNTRWKELLTEQCALLWIVRERNEDGSLKHFNIEEWING